MFMGKVVDIDSQPRRRRTRKRPSKTALVLGGGGFTGGVYEIGALRALDLLAVNSTVNNFDIEGNGTASSDLGIPGFDSDVRYENFGIPTVSVTGFSGLGAGGTNWYQFDTTFQVSNVMAYTRGSHNVRGGFDLRRMATGRRAANDPRGGFEQRGDRGAGARAHFRELIHGVVERVSSRAFAT